jgi:hypothetical protein
VATDDNTKAFLVTATDLNGSSNPVNVSDLSAGQQADVYGNYANGCFQAHTIIAYPVVTPN